MGGQHFGQNGRPTCTVLIMQTIDAHKNLGLDAEFDPLNGGSLRYYSGTAPATPATALSGNTLLLQYTLGSPAFAAASGGTKAMNAPANATEAAGGTASFARYYKSDGTTCTHQLTVGTSGQDINLSSTTIVSAQVYGPPTVTHGQST